MAKPQAPKKQPVGIRESWESWESWYPPGTIHHPIVVVVRPATEGTKHADGKA